MKNRCVIETRGFELRLGEGIQRYNENSSLVSAAGFYRFSATFVYFPVLCHNIGSNILLPKIRIYGYLVSDTRTSLVCTVPSSKATLTRNRNVR
jgi:hypothetical protein